MPTPEELQASDDAYNQATISQNNAAAAHAAFASAPSDGSTPAWDAHDARNKPPENTVARWMMNLPQNIGTSLIDDAVNAADTYHSIAGWADQHRGHMIADAYSGAVDATSDAMTSASNAVSRAAFAVVGQKAPPSVAAEPPEPVVTKPDPIDPVYDHTRSAAMALRDHLAVQDPNTADDVTQGLLKVAIPALGWSRLLSGFGVASKFYNAIGTDALTGGLSQGAHDPRLTDMLALGRHVEDKYIGALGTLDPTGGLLNYYINVMTDRSHESEAEGHFKNALDFVLGGAIVAPLFHAIPQVLKQGMDMLAMGRDAGIGKTSDVFSGPAYQRGAVGADLKDTAPATLGKDDKVVSQVQGDKIPDAGLTLEEDKAHALQSGTTPSGALTPGDVHNNAVTSMVSRNLQKQNIAGGKSSLADTIETLHAHLDESTPSGAFYKDVLGRIKDKNLDTTIVPSGTGRHAEVGSNGLPNAGGYDPKNDTAAFHTNGLAGGSDRMLHTVSHEAVHAVTSKAITANPLPFEGLLNDMAESNVIGALKKVDRYGLKNPHEMVAEAESNPRFQSAMKDAPSPSGKGSLWDDYKKLIGTTLGVGAATMASPLFDKLLTKESKGA